MPHPRRHRLVRRALAVRTVRIPCPLRGVPDTTALIRGQFDHLSAVLTLHALHLPPLDRLPLPHVVGGQKRLVKAVRILMRSGPLADVLGPSLSGEDDVL